MKLNLNYYKKDIFYNKLANEDLIIDEYINKYNDSEYYKILEKTENIETLFALSEIRKNIINWYPFSKEDEVLEIGAGLGEITGELCDKVKNVVSVEFSKTRGQAIAKRHINKENLEIIVGNLRDIEFNKKFDYITLIGILEYAPDIYESENSFIDLLKYLKDFLKENGKILIATDNKFGMRNWSVTEIEEKNLKYNSVSSTRMNNKSQLLSRNLIEDILKKADYKKMKFYYPLPDYKFTNVIFTDSFMPDKNNLHRNMSLFYDSEILSFNENDGYLQLIEDDKELFKMFSNSFFIEVGKETFNENDIKYVSYWNNRKLEYRLKTIIEGDKVFKYAVNSLSEKHINEMKTNINIMKECQIKTLDSYENNRIISNYQENCKSYDKIIIEGFYKNGIEEVMKLIESFKINILDKLEKTGQENNVFDKYGIKCEKELLDSMHFVKYGMWDLNYQNCFIVDNEFYMYDQEWMVENLPLEFIIYRGILIFDELNRIVKREEIFERLDLLKYEEIFNKLETKISSEIMSDNIMRIWNRPVKNVRGIYVENSKLLTDNIKYREECNMKDKTIKEKEKEILDKNIELENLKNKNADLENKINIIMNSKSWKLTRPLRDIRGYLNKGEKR